MIDSVHHHNRSKGLGSFEKHKSNTYTHLPKPPIFNLVPLIPFTSIYQTNKETSYAEKI